MPNSLINPRIWFSCAVRAKTNLEYMRSLESEALEVCMTAKRSVTFGRALMWALLWSIALSGNAFATSKCLQWKMSFTFNGGTYTGPRLWYSNPQAVVDELVAWCQARAGTYPCNVSDGQGHVTDTYSGSATLAGFPVYMAVLKMTASATGYTTTISKNLNSQTNPMGMTA
jgi:hypothetical protein